MKPNYLLSCMGIALAVTSLAGCGGGGGGDGSASTSSGAITSVGTISGFGSIYVNGVKFETDSANYRVDDEDYYDDSSLAVGMKVRVEGTVNPDGLTGTATSVYYDDDVEGPIDAGSINTSLDGNTKTFTIFGLDILAHATDTVYDDGASFDTLADGQVLEISGYFDGTKIVATRIEKQLDTDEHYELKGTVATYTGTEVSLALQNGANAGPFNISPTAILEVPTDPTGLFVELYLDDSTGSLLVTKIEQDDEDLLNDSDNEVSIQGVLADDGLGGLMINGVSFITSESTEYSPSSLEANLVAGMEVEVEGYMEGNVLLAEEIEQEDGDIEIVARVLDVNFTDAKNGVILLDIGSGNTLEVWTDNSTQFEDDTSFDSNGDESFNLDELALGTDYVSLDAYITDSNTLLATEIERLEGKTPSDIEVDGDISSVLSGG